MNRTWRCILKLKSHIPIKIDIGEAEELPLGVKRLNYDEGVELRARYKEASNAKGEESDALWGALLLDSFRRYLRLECEIVIECSDGEVKLRKAEELLDFFGGRPILLVTIFLAILSQNGLSPEKKRLLRSAIASLPSSEGPEKDPAGEQPETTATSVESADSADNGDAPSEVRAPSGPTDQETKTEGPPTSSTNAPSVH